MEAPRSCPEPLSSDIEVFSVVLGLIVERRMRVILIFHIY
jgi:hypothetical protein